VWTIGYSADGYMSLITGLKRMKQTMEFLYKAMNAFVEAY